jgi:hypothetical protein
MYQPYGTLLARIFNSVQQVLVKSECASRDLSIICRNKFLWIKNYPRLLGKTGYGFWPLFWITKISRRNLQKELSALHSLFLLC